VDESWNCAGCGFRPFRRDGLLSFAPEAAAGGNGFDPAAFRLLAEIEDESFWFRARNRMILWALERYFPEAGALLEVGCGTGYVLAAISAANPQMRVAGADLYAEGLALARRRVPEAAMYQLDATRIPFVAEWDVVAAFDVLEHVPDDEAFFVGMHTAVRPGGGLLVTVPQHPRLWSAADEYAHHVRRYRRSELLAKVERAGFHVQRVTSFVSLLLPALWLSRVFDRRSDVDFDPGREHASTRWSGALERVLDVERQAIVRGMSFPAGGSLLLVATRA
jgi:2-polyprenyl-3-methyl-5-hydroxy-6-metoxy-1,4-benzoquinol methylase